MNKGGRPPYEPTEADRNTVKSMAACGFPHDTICQCLGERGIAAKTLRAHFKAELKTSSAKANAAVANKLYNAAMNGEAWAICFWLKARAGWREKSPLDAVSEMTIKRVIGVPDSEV